MALSLSQILIVYSSSPWKIPRWSLTSVKLFPPVLKLDFQFFAMNFMTLLDILYTLGQSIIQVCGTTSCMFLSSNHAIAKFFRLVLLLLLLLPVESFSHQRQLIVFHWSLNDGKSPQVPKDSSQYSGRSQ